MGNRGKLQKKGGKDTHKKSTSKKEEKGEHYAPKYHRGEKVAPKPKSRLTRKVVNKTFRTDSELTEFILSEGTFKDKVTAITLVIIQEKDRKAATHLLGMAEDENGRDKAYLAITHAVKIIEYYKECKKEAEGETPKESKGKENDGKEKDEEDEEDEKSRKDESAAFCAFIGKIGFIKRFTEAISKQMATPFLKEKLCILIKSMIEEGTLSGQMLGVLMDAADPEIDKEIMMIFGHIMRNRDRELIYILRDKIVQTVLYHKNFKKVKYFITLSLSINKSEWILEEEDYKVYVGPLIKGYINILKRVYEEIDNPKIKNKTGGSVISSLLKGLLRFINWQKTIPSLSKNYTAEIFKAIGYIIFKLAYNENTNYSLPALNILEVANETEKINYSRVLGDTIRKYIYLNDLSRCEILNKAVNIPEREVQIKVIQSAYHAPIGSKYPLGCQMVTQEAGSFTKESIGYLLLSKSHDREIAESAEKISRGEPIPVYNIWE